MELQEALCRVRGGREDMEASTKSLHHQDQSSPEMATNEDQYPTRVSSPRC